MNQVPPDSKQSPTIKLRRELTLSNTRTCANCHFFSKLHYSQTNLRGVTNTFSRLKTVDIRERSRIQAEVTKHLGNLKVDKDGFACSHEQWHIDDDDDKFPFLSASYGGKVARIANRDRIDCPYFFKYREGVSLAAGESLREVLETKEQQIVNQQYANKNLRIAIIAILISGISLLCTAAAQIISGLMLVNAVNEWISTLVSPILPK